MFDFIVMISLPLQRRYKYCIMVWRSFPGNSTMHANLYAYKLKSVIGYVTVTKWLCWLRWSSPVHQKLTGVSVVCNPLARHYLKRLYKRESGSGGKASLQTEREWNTAQKYIRTFNSPKRMIWSMKTCPHNLRKYKLICVSSSETWTSS